MDPFWIIQELSVAHRPILLCGSIRPKFPTGHAQSTIHIRFLVVAAISSKTGLKRRGTHVRIARWNNGKLLDAVVNPAIGCASSSGTLNILPAHMLVLSVHRNCFNPRDHVVSMQASLESSERIFTNYGLPPSKSTHCSKHVSEVLLSAMVTMRCFYGLICGRT